jgi:hypothetical protein
MSRICFLFLLLPFLFSSCESLRNEVDPDKLNKEAAKLVVSGFISPQDSVLAVQINRSVPVLGITGLGYNSSINDVTDATVTIANGARFVALSFVRNYKGLNVNLYQADAKHFPIVEGQTYTLTVETPRGEKATAQCTIPKAPSIPELRFDSVAVRNGVRVTNGNRQTLYSKDYSVRARWQDAMGEKNYYRISAFFRYQPAPPTNTTLAVQTSTQNVFFDYSGTITDSPTTDGSLLSSREGIFYRSSSGVSTISGPMGTTFINGANSEADPNNIQLGKILRFGELTFSLLHTDENYYRYHDAIPRQGDSDGNPFAEPVPIPSNINGGLGCFAGYNRRTVLVRLK